MLSICLSVCLFVSLSVYFIYHVHAPLYHFSVHSRIPKAITQTLVPICIIPGFPLEE